MSLNRLPAVCLWILFMVLLPLRTGLTAVSVQLDAVDAQHVRVALHNSSNETVTFLSWGSPFESLITQDLLRLELVESGQAGVFTGRYVKRVDPLPEDFISVAPGDIADAVIPVTRFYDLPASGEFAITLSWTMQTLESGELSPEFLTSSPIVSDLFRPPAAVAAMPPDFDGCSVDQQSTLQRVLAEAENLTVVARDGLTGLTEDGRYNSPRYKQWFGAYASERFDRVLSVYTNAASVLGAETLRFNCTCERSGWFAYVFASQEYDVYLCPAFWRAPLLGRDSQAGTIIHELTHFPSVGSTEDHAYSTAVVQLAIDDPDRAINNADNFEYFAENVPALAIFNGVEFSWLTNGIEVSSQLLAGQSSFYKVSDAESLQLNSDSGDADLYVYRNAATEDPICRSVNTNTADECVIDPESVSYIEIVASSDANFRLIAKDEPVVDVQSEESQDNQQDTGNNDSTDNNNDADNNGGNPGAGQGGNDDDSDGQNSSDDQSNSNDQGDSNDQNNPDNEPADDPPAVQQDGGGGSADGLSFLLLIAVLQLLFRRYRICG